MENTIVQLSKYVITFLMICFTVQSFAALKERDEDERHYILMRQIIMIILMNFICFFVMFLQEGEVSTIQMFLLTMAYILGVQILYRLIYRKASMILVNNMCMLLSISMIILTRLSVSKAMSQYKILAASTLLCFIIPVILCKRACRDAHEVEYVSIRANERTVRLPVPDCFFNTEPVRKIVAEPCTAKLCMRPKTPQRQPPCIQFDSVHHEQQIGTPLMLKCVYFFKVRPILQYFFFLLYLFLFSLDN